jgi:SAM-dependent methyltransferase
MAWKEFRAAHDLLEASHRGLQRTLIPNWLSQPKALSERIDSSAYGETPPELIEMIVDALAPAAGELFVDLGCGGGNVCWAVLARGARVLGIERNPELVAAAQAFFGSRAPGFGDDTVELRCADFLETDWSTARTAYSTTARFSAATLARLAQRAELALGLRAIACLGRPLPLADPWSLQSLGRWPIVWNPGEATLCEPLWLYRRASEPGLEPQ